MITGYREEKDTIYLYVDFSYEFAKGVVDQKHPKGFIDQVKEYFERLNIRYRGKRIVLVSNGIIVGSLLLGGFFAGNAKLNEQVLLNSTNEQKQVVMVDKNIFPKNDTFENIIQLPEKEEITVVTPPNQSSKPQTPSQKPITSPTIQKPTNTTPKPSAPTTNTKPSTSQTKPPVVQEKPTTSPTVSEKIYVTLQRSNGTIEKIELEEYIIGVVAAEMPASFQKEALKAQAVAARTYTLKRLSKNLIMTDTTSTQVYKDTTQLKRLWGKKFDLYYNKIKNAVLETKGKTIRYQGVYIDAVYHSMSNGKTEDAKNVWGSSIPYLKSVDSPWDLLVQDNTSTITKDIETLNKLIGINLQDAVLMFQKNESDRIETVSFNDIRYTGVEFRSLLGLRSSDFTIELVGDEMKITTKGYGHGVGLSQYGANAMAKEGYTYSQILKHYYTGVTIQ